MRHEAPVLQKSSSDCAVCSLVMATGFGYDYVVNGLPSYIKSQMTGTGGTSFNDEYDFLESHGYNVNYITGKRLLCRDNWRQSIRNKTMLFTVVSLNRLDKSVTHAILWDGKRLLDPSKKKKYLSLLQLNEKTLVGCLQIHRRIYSVYGEGPRYTMERSSKLREQLIRYAAKGDNWVKLADELGNISKKVAKGDNWVEVAE